jgi:hypothetical protein
VHSSHADECGPAICVVENPPIRWLDNRLRLVRLGWTKSYSFALGLRNQVGTIRDHPRQTLLLKFVDLCLSLECHAEICLPLCPKAVLDEECADSNTEWLAGWVGEDLCGATGNHLEVLPHGPHCGTGRGPESETPCGTG